MLSFCSKMLLLLCLLTHVPSVWVQVATVSVADCKSVWVQVSTGLELDVSVCEATLLIVTGVLWVFVIPKYSLGSSPDFNCSTKPVFLMCQVNCSFWKCRLHIFCCWYPESVKFCRFVSRNLPLRCKYTGARLGGIEWKVTPESWKLVVEDKKCFYQTVMHLIIFRLSYFHHKIWLMWCLLAHFHLNHSYCW